MCHLLPRPPDFLSAAVWGSFGTQRGPGPLRSRPRLWQYRDDADALEPIRAEASQSRQCHYAASPCRHPTPGIIPDIESAGGKETSPRCRERCVVYGLPQVLLLSAPRFAMKGCGGSHRTAKLRLSAVSRGACEPVRPLSLWCIGRPSPVWSCVGQMCTRRTKLALRVVIPAGVGAWRLVVSASSRPE